MTKKEFIEYIAEMVVRTPSEFFNSVTIAQACLESGYGTSVLYKAFNNSFGYKAKKGEWDGDIAGDYKSDEEVNGVKIKDVPSDFRAYKSVEESVKDHAYMMSRKGINTVTNKPYDYSSTYKDALNAKTPEAQAKALTGTYAGDSKYYEKLMNIINTYGLKKYDTGQKITNPQPKSNQSSQSKPKETDNRMAKLRTPIKKHTKVNMGGQIGKIEYIVIHFIGASGQALANANYFYNVYREASAQLFIDPNVTYEVVPENRVAWHVGDGRGRYGITNSNSIGIEGCQDVSTGRNVWEWDFHPNTYEQMLLQTSAWMDKYNVPINKVVRHYDASRKSCPGNWMANDWAKWKKFKKDLAELRKTGSVNVGGSTESNRYNPQGFQEVAIAEYRKPTNEFKTLFTNSDATPREVFNWYNPETKKYMISPNAPKYAGVKDKVEDIMDVSIGYSKKAYLLKNAKTWILEQDLKEPRAEWDKGLTASTYVVVKGDYLFKIAEQFDTTVENLKKWNKLESNLIFTGMELFVVEPLGQIEEDESPVSTDDSDNKPSETIEEDKGEKTPAVELAENELMDAKGNIFVRSEGWILTEKE